MTMPKITSSMLRAKNACKKEVAIFESEWPDGLEVTETVADRVIELGLSVGWVVKNFLKASAWAEYNRVTTSAWAEYNRVTTSAWAEYERVTAPAWAVYNRVKVRTAIRLYIEHEKQNGI
jgi:hypothetical protein